MKKRIITAVLVILIVIMSGCSVFKTKMEGNLNETEYLMGEIEGKLSSGTFESFGCYKVGNIVSASARYYGVNNEITNGVCFKLPQGFRPKVETRCNGYIVTDNTFVPVFIIINTDGDVSVAYSGNRTMTQIYFSAVFPS